MEINLSENVVAVATKIASVRDVVIESLIVQIVEDAFENLLRVEFAEKKGTTTKYNPTTGESVPICLFEMVQEMNREGSKFFERTINI